MNHDRPNSKVIFFSIVFTMTNFYLSYIFSGRSISYIFGNVFGLTMIALTISSFFQQYRNPQTRWSITLNTMIITFLAIVGNILISMVAPH